jgi:hypothetical protein
MDLVNEIDVAHEVGKTLSGCRLHLSSQEKEPWRVYLRVYTSRSYVYVGAGCVNICVSSRCHRTENKSMCCVYFVRFTAFFVS